MLEIIRGNTDDWGVYLPEGEYTYTSGDIMTFVAKEQPKKSMPAALKKTLEYDSEAGAFRLHFDPEDTADLECWPDMEYWFDIGLEFANGDFCTVIEMDRLRIMPANAEISSE